jgi:hypothetical protein
LKLTGTTIIETAPNVTKERDPNEILRPRQIEQETNTSWKTISRARPDKVVQLGLRAVGMRRGDALRPVSRNR